VKLPDLPELELSDRRLIHDGAPSVDYDSIESITFKLIPLLQNRLSRPFWGIDTTWMPGSSASTAILALHLAGGNTIWLSRGWDLAVAKSRVEAICAAAEFLSERTFERRFGSYRKQLEEAGRFSYGRYAFDRNGDVLRFGRRIYNVRDTGFSIVLGAFHVHLECKETLSDRLWSLLGQSGHTIGISKDRDCFLSMYRMMYGAHWPDEHYRDDARAARHDE
jgi:hypothetical protein